MKITLIFSIIAVLLVAAAGCTPGAASTTAPAASAPSASPTPPNFKLTRFIWDIDSLYLSGATDLPDGTRLSTGLYKDGQAVDWWPPLAMAYVQDHKWDVRVHGLQSNIPAFLPDFAPGYSFRIYEGYNAEKGAAFALPFPAPEITPASGLADSQWNVVLLNGKPLLAGTHINLDFDKNKKGIAGGSGTINSYGGHYGAEAPDKVFFYEISLTSMGGPPDWEQQERDYLRCLHKADFFKITDDRLEIYDSSHAPLLVLEKIPELAMDPAALVGTQWVLESLNGESILDGLSVTLNFDSDIAASGRAGIFWYWLSYQASGDNIRWGIQSARGNGEMSSELEKQALDYTGMIMWAANYRLTSDKLEILTSKGQTLTYRPLTVQANIKFSKLIWNWDSIFIFGTASLPDQARLETQLYKDGQPVDWWNNSSSVSIRNGKWSANADPRRGRDPVWQFPDYGPGYSFQVWDTDHPEVKACFDLPFPNLHSPPEVDLEGSQWKVVSVRGNPVVPGTYLSLYFIDGGVAGCSGLNTFGGNYLAEAPNSLLIYGGGITLIGGPDNIIQQENAFHRALYDATSYQIKDDQLEIFSNSETGPSLVLERIPEYPARSGELTGTKWQLVSAKGKAVPDDLSVTLNFETGSLASGQAGRYKYDLTFIATGDTLQVSSAVTAADTLPRPEDPEIDFPFMPGGLANYTLSPDRLEILTDRGVELIYKPFTNGVVP